MPGGIPEKSINVNSTENASTKELTKFHNLN
jgi:hypothetical protein